MIKSASVSCQETNYDKKFRFMREAMEDKKINKIKMSPLPSHHDHFLNVLSLITELLAPTVIDEKEQMHVIVGGH